MNGFFVTATDTEVGKTWVSRILADALSQTRSIAYAKPVQTGCVSDEKGALRAPDFEWVLAGKAAMLDSYDLHVPYRFEPACSPHLAAEMANAVIEPARLLSSLDALSRKADGLIVEGAGGLFAPIRRDYYMIDLLQETRLAAVLVTSPRLGTLNHTLLSLEALNNRAIPLAGVVFNNHADFDENFIFRDNARTLAQATSPRPFLELGYKETKSSSIREFVNELSSKYF